MSSSSPNGRIVIPKSRSADSDDGDAPLRPPPRGPRLGQVIPSSNSATTPSPSTKQGAALKPGVLSPGAIAVQGIDSLGINGENLRAPSPPSTDTSSEAPKPPPPPESALIVPIQQDAIVQAKLVPDEDEIAKIVQQEVKELLENERKRQVTVNAVAIDDEEKGIDPVSLAVNCGIGGESGISRRNLFFIVIGFVLLIGGIATGAALAVGGGNGGEMPPTPSPTSNPSPTFEMTATSKPAATLGDWEFCGHSDECSDGCCSTNSASSFFYHDGRLRCTPVDVSVNSSCINYNMSDMSLKITKEIDVETTTLETIQDTFDRYYGYIHSMYNPGATTSVKILIQEEWDGTPGSTSFDTVNLRAIWLKQNPLDVAGMFVHLLVYVVEYTWQNVPDYFVSGFADFIRDATGVDIASGGSWTIPDGFSAGQTYRDGFGNTAAFVKWMVGNDLLVLEDLILAFRDGSYSGDVTWLGLTGKTLDDLWELYSTS